MVLSIHSLYYLVGGILAITALMSLRDRTNPKRHTSALFWGIYALVFLVGDVVPALWVGIGAIGMALIAGLGGVGAGRHEPRQAHQYAASAGRLGNALFLPALAIPVITVAGTI